MGEAKRLKQIIDNHPDDSILVADGFDDAVIGVATDFTKPRLIYSVTLCIDILMDVSGAWEMNHDEAMEYFTFNVSGAWVGEQTPIWCWDL
jgi:hypothetical protein